MVLAIQSQAMRAHEMISDLMLFARPPALACDEVDLVGLVNSVVEEMRVDAVDQQTSLEARLPSGTATVTADRTQLEVALEALLRNALEALGGGGKVLVGLRKSTPRAAPEALSAVPSDHPDAAEGWEITVTDNGPGMSHRVRRHLFDPFFSGREAGRGLGFGLSKCWRIAHEHGGSIAVDSRLGWGTQMIFSLPVSPSAAAGSRSLAATRVC